MATKIVIYTGNSCPKCKRAKEMLENCPVEVEIIERNIDESEDARDYLVSIIESNTLPTLVFVENNEDKHTFRGFDENIGEIMEALGL
ncbi:glutaredoxin family protein [Bacillus mycoides]|uniref:glutaredoxin family protein n=1 Tax=Bacillus mycoides TaxID=1405 RepID=UPI001C00EB70|nr:glutaredoxin family protein [Bacillus mycoides]QWI52493.1 glutaredoxin family protein [Bacillus mycoides]